MDKLLLFRRTYPRSGKNGNCLAYPKEWLRSHWIGGENLPDNQEENIMIEVYYAEDDETIGKSV